MSSNQRERSISHGIQTFLKTIGATCYSTEQGYRPGRGGARVTAGVPDLLIFLPEPSNLFMFVEVKSAKGRIRPAQAQFAEECEKVGIPCPIWRDVRDAFDYLESIGHIEVPE